jgi:hypothetical protein
MLKRPTWILLVGLALVISAYLVINATSSTHSLVSTPTLIVSNFLITQTDDPLQVLGITDQKNRSVLIKRDTSGKWIVIQPNPGAADQALAEAAATQIGALRIITTLDKQLNLAEAGLEPPAYTISLTFSSGLTHEIQVGTLTPTNSGYYILAETGELFVVSQSSIEALLNLLTAPPFAATDTPAPTNDATVTPVYGNVTLTP